MAETAARTVATLPDIWSIRAEAEPSQHMLATRPILLGATATMAAWRYEQDGQRIGKVAAVYIGNALVCLAAGRTRRTVSGGTRRRKRPCPSASP